MENMTDEIGSDEEFWEAVQLFMFSPDKLDEAEKEIGDVLDLVDIDVETALDMPCGVGRHSDELSKRGIQVTGVDGTEAYIESAIETVDDVEFVCKDMRKFSSGEQKFDLAINLWNSFGYFREHSENMKVLRNFHDSLREGGALVMQVIGKEIVEPGHHWTEQNGMYLLEEYSISDDYSWLENRWILVKEGEIREFNPSYRVYSATEFREMLKDAGFSEVKIYGGLDGSKYDSSSDYLVITAIR